jgi:hypothetical protein
VIPLRSDTTFLFILVCLLFAALVVTSADFPAAPAYAALTPRPLPTSTPTPTPDWWAYVSTATPTLPGLPALPAPSLGSGGSSGASDGPLAFQVVACPGGGTSIQSISRHGVWWAVSGVAQTDPFWYWKMELSADGQDATLSQSKGWTVLYRSEAPTAGGHLMDFNTTTVPRGSYQMRLTVVKRDGNYEEPCVIAIGT